VFDEAHRGGAAFRIIAQELAALAEDRRSAHVPLVAFECVRALVLGTRGHPLPIVFDEIYLSLLLAQLPVFRAEPAHRDVSLNSGATGPNPCEEDYGQTELPHHALFHDGPPKKG